MNYVYNTADPVLYSMLHEWAKENKKYQTEAERFLWERLRRKRLGKKFNRQHIIGQYIVDFVCLEEMLVIEVDGGYHCQPVQELLDEKRTERLNDMGFTVIRFDNETIIGEIDDVIKVICRYIF
ncbi:MAG: endonuclease domain-containing protein [Prevotellaceae bacterium]|nr:endonuclease domain-containing protein [Prevotellaceae bacterium]